METYPFKDDNGKTHQLSFEQMMESKDGFYTKPDGTVLRRVHESSSESGDRVRKRTEILSDALGFSKLQLSEMQDHLKQSGCKGVEFVQDKTEETFMQVKCDSPRALARYMKARGFVDQNSRNGSRAMLSERDFENARELLLRN